MNFARRGDKSFFRHIHMSTFLPFADAAITFRVLGGVEFLDPVRFNQPRGCCAEAIVFVRTIWAAGLGNQLLHALGLTQQGVSYCTKSIYRKIFRRSRRWVIGDQLEKQSKSENKGEVSSRDLDCMRCICDFLDAKDRSIMSQKYSCQQAVCAKMGWTTSSQDQVARMYTFKADPYRIRDPNDFLGKFFSLSLSAHLPPLDLFAKLLP